MADEKTEAELQQELFQHAMAPEPQEATPPEPPKPSPEPAPPPQPPQPEPPQPSPAADAGVPSWRLREEADARRAAEDRARALESRLGEIQAHIERSAAASAAQPDFFADPNKATQEIVIGMLKQAFTPFVEEVRRGNMHRDQLIAGVVHGVDNVREAEDAFLAAMNDQSLDPVEYERVVQSPNRYDEVVRWHQRQSVLASVGTDPAAWFDQQLMERMKDPQFQAQLLDKVRSGAATRPSETRIPPSLSRVPAAKANAEPVGDMSDASLWSFAKPGRQ